MPVHAGTGIALIAIITISAPELFVGTAAAGFAFSLRCVLGSVVPLARPREREGLLSAVFLVSYVAMDSPAGIASFLVVHDGGLLSTAREYPEAAIELGLAALIGQVAAQLNIKPLTNVHKDATTALEDAQAA